MNPVLRTELADAAARRAALIDRYQMGEPTARCMACRARGLFAVVVLAGACWVFGPRAGRALLGLEAKPVKP